MDFLYLGTETGLFRGYPWMAGLDAPYDHRKPGWYMRVLDQEHAVWNDTYVHAVTKELMLTCSRAFYCPRGKAVGVVEAGNLEYPLRLRTGDELERLADSFRTMTQDLLCQPFMLSDLREFAQ